MPGIMLMKDCNLVNGAISELDKSDLVQASITDQDSQNINRIATVDVGVFFLIKCHRYYRGGGRGHPSQPVFDQAATTEWARRLPEGLCIILDVTYIL